MAGTKHVLVIGAGIAGLACAYRLHRLGVSVSLVEEAARAGGLIGTIQQNGFLFESGPQSFSGTDEILDLARELGIESEICKADPRAPRYVLRRGRLLKVPTSPQAMLSTSLLGLGARWKIASEPFGRTRPPSQEESVAEFVRRKFGREILEYLVSPFVSGIYAGDSEKLSLRAAFPTLEEWERRYGSVLRGVMKSRPSKGQRKGPVALCSFRRGLATLIETLAAKLGDRLHLGARAEELRARDEGERYEIRVKRNGLVETAAADAVVLATPAYASAHLISSISPSLSKVLSGIAYAPVAVVASGYHARQIRVLIDGFGVLIPRAEKIRTLGIVWNSSLFPDRAGAGRVILTGIAGGATDPGIVDLPEDEIARIVQHDSEEILDITGSPIETAVWKHPKALPQYNLGHGHAVRAIRDAEHSIPGLYVAGNFLNGPSLGKCIEKGFETAEAVRNYLQTGR
jgi:protoporphyrinogen/coproporphyrinogen III oxidase